MYRNGIQQKLNSWQDRVSGTDCLIQHQSNWTYVFDTKEVHSSGYLPSIYLKPMEGLVQFELLIALCVPFSNLKHLLIGDWYNSNSQFIDVVVPNIIIDNLGF